MPKTMVKGSYARSEATRAKILSAALAEASDAGFHKSSVTRIAARAGVAVGVLNYHFGSRGALLRELMGSLVSDLLSRLHVVYPGDSTNFFEHERDGLLVYLKYLRANPAYARLADEVKLHEPALYQRAVKDWIDEFVRRLREGIELDNIAPMSDQHIVAQGYFLLGTRSFLDHMIENTQSYPGDQAVVDAYLNLIKNGLQQTQQREQSI